MNEVSTTTWQRSSFCSSGACVEVAMVGDDVAMRDGKNTDIPALVFSKADWNTFLDQVAAAARSRS